MSSNAVAGFVRRYAHFFGAILIALVLYGGFVGHIYSIQRSLLYFPTHVYVTPEAAGADPALHELPVTTADGLALKAWYAPATRKRLTIVFFHGNADGLETVADIARPYIRAGYGMLIGEYRGFSGFPGTPTEAGLYADARADIRALLATGVKESDIVIFGHSLGTGVATQMATEFHGAGLILLAPFLSAIRMGEFRYPYLPVGLLMKDRFENDRKIKSVSMPLLIANGGLDNVIPSSQGRDLFALADQPKQFYFAPGGGHNDMFGDGFTDASLQWLDGLDRAAAPAR